jgi:hypothetical protein
MWVPTLGPAGEGGRGGLRGCVECASQIAGRQAEPGEGEEHSGPGPPPPERCVGSQREGEGGVGP